MPKPVFIGASIYRGSSYGDQHPLAIPRVSTVMDLSRVLGWLPAAQYKTSPRAKPSALGAFHDAGYLAALQRAEADQAVDAQTRQRYGLGTLSNPVFPEMFRRPATAAGGSILGAHLVAQGGSVFNPGGGTHHGLRDRAAGFCYLNDPALALLSLRSLGLRRILYLDIDAHHCDGVELAFEGALDVRLISVHEAARWPFTGALTDRAGGAALNLPVPRGFNDSEFAHLTDHVILPALDRLSPEVVVLQCGADAVTEDPLARLALSNQAHVSLVRRLRDRCSRLLVLGGGGYNPWSVGRLWTAIWGALNGLEAPEMLPPDAQAVLEALHWRRQRGPLPAYLTQTLADTPRPGRVRPEITSLAETAKDIVASWDWSG